MDFDRGTSRPNRRRMLGLGALAMAGLALPGTSSWPVASAAEPAAPGGTEPVPGAGPGQTDPGLRTRKEIRTLTVEEFRRFTSAVHTLHAWGRYEQYVAARSRFVPSVLGWPVFLPWHRWFLLDFEQVLRRVDPQVSIPYWNHSLDSAAPEQSSALSSALMGGNGRGPDHCVTDGAFAHWIVSNPTRHCLRRVFDDGTRIRPWLAPEVVATQVERASDYPDWWRFAEFRVTAEVHSGIGGDMADARYAPNDPLYWANLAYTDKLWADWQAVSPPRTTAYSGTGPDGFPARSSDYLPGYPTVQVYRTFSIRDLGYQYGPTAA